MTELLDLNPKTGRQKGKLLLGRNWFAVPKGKETENGKKKYQGSKFLKNREKYGKELVLEPGSHRFRVAVICPSARATFNGSVRAVSNVIEVVTIGLPTESKG